MFRRLSLPFILFVTIVALLELMTSSGRIPAYIFPAPSEVWKTLSIDTVEYLLAAQKTLMSALAGLGLSIVAGVTVAVLMSLSRTIESALYPYAVFFQTVPLISIAPILVIWFGYGMPTVIVAAFIVSLFPIVINSLAGIQSTDAALRDLFTLYGANTWQTLVKLRIPNALPQMMTGVRVSSGLSLIGAIVGEFIAGGGLGGLIDSARTQQRLDKVFAAVLISSLTGIALLSLTSRRPKV